MILLTAYAQRVPSVEMKDQRGYVYKFNVYKLVSLGNMSLLQIIHPIPPSSRSDGEVFAKLARR